MDDLFLVKAIDEKRVLCLSPLSRKTYRAAAGHGLGGDGGYFIYETDSLKPEAGIEILAKAKSASTGQRIFDLLGGC